jgi:hypothetical protein
MKVNEKINKLTLIEIIGTKCYGKDNQVKKVGLFLCDCGIKKVMIIKSVEYQRSKSCGKCVLEFYKRDHPLYSVWDGIIQRCTNPKQYYYSRYGGRGICVCTEWRNDFMSFYKWSLSNGWEEGLQIDRINNDGNYEPENCRFVTHKENTAVGRRNIFKTNTSGFNGVSYFKQQKSWCASITLNYKTTKIGMYKNLNDAVLARINKEIELFGEQKTNFHFNGESNV